MKRIMLKEKEEYKLIVSTVRGFGTSVHYPALRDIDAGLENFDNDALLQYLNLALEQGDLIMSDYEFFCTPENADLTPEVKNAEFKQEVDDLPF